ncbi:MAG: H/ACA ribonucleoprotein complex subunit GAR1 [Promethearchaeota archaeon]
MSDLIKLGKPIRFTKNHHLLFRIGKPQLGLISFSVVDASMEKVGKVYDLFGPVDRPFLSITIDDNMAGESSTLLEKNYFIIIERKRKKYKTRKKNKGKNRFRS